MNERESNLPIVLGVVASLVIHVGAVCLGMTFKVSGVRSLTPVSAADAASTRPDPSRTSSATTPSSFARLFPAHNAGAHPAQRAGAHQPLTSAKPEPAKTPAPTRSRAAEEEVQLGSDNGGQVTTMAWISYDDFRKLQGLKGQTVQPALQKQADPVQGAPMVIDATPPAPTPGGKVPRMAMAGAPRRPEAPGTAARAAGSGGTHAPSVRRVGTGGSATPRPPSAAGPRPTAVAPPHPGGPVTPAPGASGALASAMDNPVAAPEEAMPASRGEPQPPPVPAKAPAPTPPTPAPAPAPVTKAPPAKPTAPPGAESDQPPLLLPPKRSGKPGGVPVPANIPPESAGVPPTPAASPPPTAPPPTRVPQPVKQPALATATSARPVGTAPQPPVAARPSAAPSSSHPTTSPASQGYPALALATPMPPAPGSHMPQSNPSTPVTAAKPGSPGSPGVPGAPGAPGSPGTTATASGLGPLAMAASARPGQDGQPSNPTGAPRSDKESDPISLTSERGVVHPGGVYTIRGIEIKTVHPRFGPVTAASAMPGNTDANIVFDKTGRVIKVTITQSSGYDDVDGPILASLYEWKATGKRLAELNHSFSIPVTIVLTNGD